MEEFDDFKIYDGKSGVTVKGSMRIRLFPYIVTAAISISVSLLLTWCLFA